MKTHKGFIIPLSVALTLGTTLGAQAGVDDFTGTKTPARSGICAKAATPGALGESMLLAHMCEKKMAASGTQLVPAVPRPQAKPNRVVVASAPAPAKTAPAAAQGGDLSNLAGVMSDIRASKRENPSEPIRAPEGSVVVAANTSSTTGVIPAQSTRELIHSIKAKRRLTLKDNLWLIGGFR